MTKRLITLPMNQMLMYMLNDGMDRLAFDLATAAAFCHANGIVGKAEESDCEQSVEFVFEEV